MGLHEYIVSEGDSVYSVAKKFGVDDRAVCRLNGGAERLDMGQILRIPVFSLYTRLHRGQSVSSAAGAMQVPPEAVSPTADGEIFVLFQ